MGVCCIMLSVLIPEGFPVKAQEYLSKAIQASFGGMADIEMIPKDKIKTKVRLSFRDTNIPLVVLDKDTEEQCAGIDNGLFASDRYLCYESLEKFVKDLNEKYNLSMVIEEDTYDTSLNIFSGDAEDVYTQDDIDRIIAEKDATREAIVLTKDRKIHELEARVKELEQYQFKYEELEDRLHDSGSLDIDSEVEQKESVSKEAYDSLSEQNKELLGSLMDLQSDLSNANGRIKELEREISEGSISDSKLAKNYEMVRKELSDLQNTYTQQSALLEKKESRIKVLTEKLDEEREQRQSSDNTINNLSETIADLRSELSDKKAENNTKEREISRLYKEVTASKEKEISSDMLEEKNNIIDQLKSELSQLTSENAEYQKTTSNMETIINNQKVSIAKLEGDVKNLKDDIEGKDAKIAELSNNVSELNVSLVDAKTKIEFYEKENSGVENESSIEYTKVKKELIKIKDSIFYKLSEESSENSHLRKVNLLPEMSANDKFKNIYFIYSGSTESTPGTYKEAYTFISPVIKKGTNILLLDLCSDTFLDKYIGGVTKVASGSEWFKKGGNIQKYLLPTSHSNVKILGVGVSYINEAFLLNVDWNSRFKELERSGYTIFVFCGCISNMFGRIFHLSFAHHGRMSLIFAKGSSVSSLRPLLSSVRGIDNISYSKIAFFDYTPEIGDRYKKPLEATNECQVVAYKKVKG